MGLQPTVKMVEEAVSEGHVETMRFFLDLLPDHQVLDKAILNACTNDTVEALRWLHKKTRATEDCDLSAALRLSRNLDVMDELIEEYETELQLENKFDLAEAARSMLLNFDMSVRLIESKIGPLIEYRPADLFVSGSTDVVLYTLEHGRCETIDHNILPYEVRLAKDVFDRLVFDDPVELDRPNLLNLAAAFSSSMLFARLYAWDPEQCTTRTAEMVAESGNPRMIRPLVVVTTAALAIPAAFIALLHINTRKPALKGLPYPKPRFLMGNMYEILSNLEGRLDTIMWKWQRKVSSHIFTGKNFRDVVEGVIFQEMDKFLSVLDGVADSGSVIDLHNLLHCLTMDSFGLIGFGQHLRTLDDPDHVPAFVKAFDEVIPILNVRFPNRMWPITERLLGTRKKINHGVKIIEEVVYEQIRRKREERKQGGAATAGRHRDLIDLYMDYDEGMGDRQLRDMVLNMILAGRDTTAQALSWGFWLLASHPEVVAKMRDEIAEITSNELPSYDQVGSLKYVTAVFFETLRLYPSVPFNTKVAVKDDILPGGIHVRAGTKINWLPYCMGRMPQIWGPDAEEFRPARWFDESGNLKRESPFKWSAFNAGPRVCLGQQMATVEAVIALVGVVSRFDVVVEPGADVRPGLSVTLSMKNGLPASHTMRSRFTLWAITVAAVAVSTVAGYERDQHFHENDSVSVDNALPGIANDWPEDGSVTSDRVFDFPSEATNTSSTTSPTTTSEPASPPTPLTVRDRVFRQILVNGFARCCKVIPEARPDHLQTPADCIATVGPKVRACNATTAAGGTKETSFNFRCNWVSISAIEVNADAGPRYLVEVVAQRGSQNDDVRIKTASPTMLRSFNFPAELIRKVVALCDNLTTAISIELLLSPYPHPYWIRICNSPDTVRDAVVPLLPVCWAQLTPAHFPRSLALASQHVLLKWDNVATIPAHVVAWVAQFAPSLLTYGFVTAAATAGRLDLLSLLHAFDVRKFCSETMDAAAGVGQLAVVRFLHTKRSEGCTDRAMTEAIRHRHLETAQFLAAHRTELCRSEALSYAVANGDVDAVRFLQTVVGCEPGTPEITRAPDLATLQVLHEELRWPLTPQTPVAMAARGHADALRYCLERNAGFDPKELFEVLCKQGNVETMAVASEFFPNEWSKHKWDSFAARGALGPLRWLYEHQTGACTESAIISAARAGHLEVIEFLGTKGFEPTQYTLLKAVQSGNVELVRYFHTVPTLEGHWVPKLVQTAAVLGHFDMTKYLWEELGIVPKTLDFEPYHPDCPDHIAITFFAVGKGMTFPVSHLYRAFIEAAKSCTLETIKRIHELLPSPAAQNLHRAYEGPAERGRLDVIQYLHANDLGCPRERALLLAARRGQTEVARYLVDEMGLQPTVKMVEEAASEGHVETMRFFLDLLRANVFLDKAIMSASRNRTVEGLRWLHKKRRALLDGFFSNYLSSVRSLDVIEELIEVYGTNLADRYGLVQAAKTLVFETSKRVVESEIGRDIKYDPSQLFASGNTDLIIYSLDHDRCKTFSVGAVPYNLCLKQDAFDSYIFDDPLDASRPNLLNLAAAYPASMLFVRLYARHSDKCTTRTAEMAARGGNLRMLRFLSRRAPHVFAESVMTSAVESMCSLEVVEYLLMQHPLCVNARVHLEVLTSKEPEFEGDRLKVGRKRAAAKLVWEMYGGGLCPLEAVVNSCRNNHVELLRLFLSKLDARDETWRKAVEACCELMEKRGLNYYGRHDGEVVTRLLADAKKKLELQGSDGNMQ
ncbi:hypothetical protein HDU96_000209 [Phlyctochytrium bullatum]|nr:hypothetical protein HDU96_000209 [Phlyctochytrium bullatum]